MNTSCWLLMPHQYASRKRRSFNLLQIHPCIFGIDSSRIRYIYIYIERERGYRGVATLSRPFYQASPEPEGSQHLDFHSPKGFAKDDIIVHLHIQKAGGSYFGRLLLDVHYPNASCVSRKGKLPLEEFISLGNRVGPKSFTCPRNNTSDPSYYQPLFSRFSAGWPCGVHPSYARMLPCVLRETNASLENLKFVTTIRNPVDRFISEYFHGYDGWSRTDGYSERNAIPGDYYCNGTLRRQENAPCSRGKSTYADGSYRWDIIRSHYRANDWHIPDPWGREPSLWDYLACPSSYHHNRQTRMLATDLPCISTEREWFNPAYQKRVLDSAKENLLNMAFFGIEERLYETMKLFEWTFGLSGAHVAPKSTRGSSVSSQLHFKSVELIQRHENLDMALYNYAVKVFEDKLLSCGALCH